MMAKIRICKKNNSVFWVFFSGGGEGGLGATGRYWAGGMPPTDLPHGCKWESFWITDSRASVWPCSIGIEWHFPSLTHCRGTFDIALKCPQVPVPPLLYVKDVGFGAKSQRQRFFKHPYQGKQHQGDILWVHTCTWDCVPEGHRWREVAVLIYGLPDISHSLGLFLEGSSMGKRRKTWCIIIVKKKKNPPRRQHKISF